MRRCWLWMGMRSTLPIASVAKQYGGVVMVDVSPLLIRVAGDTFDENPML